jgi:hypothetical protein
MDTERKDLFEGFAQMPVAAGGSTLSREEDVSPPALDNPFCPE